MPTINGDKSKKLTGGTYFLTVFSIGFVIVFKTSEIGLCGATQP